MVAARHNLTRRALLGVGIGAWAVGGDAFAAPLAADAQGAAELGARSTTVLRHRWERAVAAFRQAESRLAGFKAAEARLPAERRAFPACKALEQQSAIWRTFAARRFAGCSGLRRPTFRRSLSSSTSPSPIGRGSWRAAKPASPQLRPISGDSFMDDPELTRHRGEVSPQETNRIIG